MEPHGIIFIDNFEGSNRFHRRIIFLNIGRSSRYIHTSYTWGITQTKIGVYWPIPNQNRYPGFQPGEGHPGSVQAAKKSCWLPMDTDFILCGRTQLSTILSEGFEGRYLRIHHRKDPNKNYPTHLCTMGCCSRRQPILPCARIKTSGTKPPLTWHIRNPYITNKPNTNHPTNLKYLYTVLNINIPPPSPSPIDAFLLPGNPQERANLRGAKQNYRRWQRRT